jgi:hypothetical protein
MKHPIDYMKPETFWKAYWNYDSNDWHDWFNSFKTLPLKDYNNHIGSIIDMYADYLNWQYL